MAQSSLGSPGLLSAEVQAAGDIVTDRSFARDLNLDQIVAAIAGDREERDLIMGVLFAALHDAGAVRYRQEVFQDLENPALFGEVGEISYHLRQLRFRGGVLISAELDRDNSGINLVLRASGDARQGWKELRSAGFRNGMPSRRMNPRTVMAGCPDCVISGCGGPSPRCNSRRVR